MICRTLAITSLLALSHVTYTMHRGALPTTLSLKKYNSSQHTHNALATVPKDDNRSAATKLAIIRAPYQLSGKQLEYAEKIAGSRIFRGVSPNVIIFMEEKDRKTNSFLINIFETDKKKTAKISEEAYNNVVDMPQGIKSLYKDETNNDYFVGAMPSATTQMQRVIFSTATGAIAGALIGGTVNASRTTIDQTMNQQQQKTETINPELEKICAYAEAADKTYGSTFNERYPMLQQTIAEDKMQQDLDAFNKTMVAVTLMDADDMSQAFLLKDPLLVNSGSLKDLWTQDQSYIDNLAKEQAHKEAYTAAQTAGELAAAGVVITVISSGVESDGDMLDSIKCGAGKGAFVGGAFGFMNGMYTRKKPIIVTPVEHTIHKI